MSEAPPIDDCVDCEPEGDLNAAGVTRCENAMSRVLQWSPSLGVRMPSAGEFRDACRGLCHKRSHTSKGCFKWVADRMGLHRITLKRIMDGTSPLDVIHIAALQGLIMTDWVRSEGVEPRDIYRPLSTVNLPRRLRARMPEPAPRTTSVVPASGSGHEDATLSEMEDQWEIMCQQLIEDGKDFSSEEFDEFVKRLSSLSNRIKAKHIRLGEGAKGKYYVDHADCVAADVHNLREKMGIG